MKAILKGDEPPSFAQYRQARPGTTWDQFRDDPFYGGQQAYQDVKRQLVKDQRCLCAYCERRIAKGISDAEMDSMKAMQRVEHFHPKSDTQGPIPWTLHWPNLWAVCKGGDHTPVAGEPLDLAENLPPQEQNLSCDAHKNRQVETGQLPLACEGWVLAPEGVPTSPALVRFTNAGIVEPHPVNCAAWNSPVNYYADSQTLVAQTIKHLNLNCNRLTRLRQILLGQLEKEIQQLRRLIPGATPAQVLTILARRKFPNTADRPWPEFFSLIRDRLGVHAETHLQSIAYLG